MYSYTKLFVTYLDNVLVAVAYYIGTEKEYDGVFPFAIIAYITTGCMISSEIVAQTKTRKRKISPAVANTPNGNPGKNLVISNFIPFTTLNIIFAFSIVISAIIRVIQQTQIGVPKLSIQMVIMLICLLFSNPKAKRHFKRRCSALRGVDQIQIID